LRISEQVSALGHQALRKYLKEALPLWLKQWPAGANRRASFLGYRLSLLAWVASRCRLHIDLYSMSFGMKICDRARAIAEHGAS